MDDKENFHDATEYKFSETDIGANIPSQQDFQTETTADHKMESGMTVNLAMLRDLAKNLNWKRFAAPVGIVIAVFVLYFVSTFMASKKNSVLEEQNLLIQERAASATAQPMISGGSLVDNSESFSVSIDGNNGSKRIDELNGSLQRKIDDLSKQIVENNGRLTRTSESTVECQREVAEIKQNINILVEGVKQMLIDIDQLKQKNVPKKEVEVTVAKPKVGYSVLAIVPGRVWLRSEHGETTTLKVGDELTGYGRVRAISVRQGMVMMSDGSVIQYAVN